MAAEGSSDVLAAAWAKDAAALGGHLSLAGDRLSRQRVPLLPAFKPLAQTVGAWCEGCGVVKRRRTDGHPRAPSVVPPFALPTWVPAEPTTTRAETTLRVATFGWWEVMAPSDCNVRRLCEQLRLRSVRLCAVTGLPSAGATALRDGTLEYRWFGELRESVDGAGFLVHRSLQDSIRRLPDPVCSTSRRCSVSLHGRAWTAVYGPCGGRWPLQTHKAFLCDTLACVVALGHQHQGSSWAMGDFNLRGVAVGDSLPAACPRQADLAAWFRETLATAGLAALPSPKTHVAGGALDLHVVGKDSRHVACVVWLPGRLSDHALVTVDVDIPASTVPIAPSAPRAKRQAAVWIRDEEVWRKALREVSPLITTAAGAIEAAVDGCLLVPPARGQREAILDSATAVLRAIIVSAGHAGGAVRLLGGHGKGKCAHADRASARIVLADIQEAYEQAVAAAAAAPQDTVAQAHVTIVWAQLEAARQELKLLPTPIVAPGFIAACLEGGAAVQRWLSAASRGGKPQLPLETAAQAAAVLDFRGRIGQLDPRCCPAAEAEACRTADHIRRKWREDVAPGKDAPTTFVVPGEKRARPGLFRCGDGRPVDEEKEGRQGIGAHPSRGHASGGCHPRVRAAGCGGGRLNLGSRGPRHGNRRRRTRAPLQRPREGP